MSLLVRSIGTLVTNAPEHGPGPLATIDDAALVVGEDGHVAWVGPSSQAPAADTCLDVAGRAVLPGFVDSHSHPIFAGDRSVEFAARMSGEAYSAGGIGTTVAATRAASDEQLRANLDRLLAEGLRSGTTTQEIKTGYGLTTEDELRALRVAAPHGPELTFMGAHVVPAEYRERPDEYVELVCTEMIPACAPHAKWIDVFCDRGAFTVEQARRIITSGVAHGLQPRLHANQLEPGGGLRLAVELGAASADHATHASDEDIAALADSDVVVTLLPGAEFSTRAHYPDARRFLDAGITVALAADCNPGSSFTTNLPFCIAVAVREMRMSPDQAVWSATAGGAAALRRTDVGHLGVGARADFMVLDAPNHIHLAYRPGVPLVRAVYRGGEPAASSSPTRGEHPND